MAVRGHYERLTANGSGAATMTIRDNGLVAMVHVSPVSSVNASSTAALKQSFPSDGSAVVRTVVAATACNAAVDLWEQPGDGLFSISKNRDLQIIIAGATANDKFDVYVDVIFDE